MVFLVSLIVPLLSFFLQSYPRFLNKHFGVDVWKRMIEADLVRKNGHRIPKGIVKDGSIIEGYFDNPPIFPWILSLLSKKTLLNTQGFIAPIFDCLNNLVVFILTYHITGDIRTSLFAQLIYASIPLTILENSYLTPRSFGYFNFTLAFVPLLLYGVTPNIYYLLIAYIFTILIFLTHRFAMQSLLFICLFFSIIDKNPVYLALYLISLITALILTRGYYLRVLEGHWSIINFWINNYKYRFAHQIRGLNEEKRKMDFAGFIYFLLSKFAPITLIATNLWLITPLYLTLAPMLQLPLPINLSNELFFKLSIWTIFFYVLASIVLLVKYLIPIGEGQRYLEMATVPTAVLSSIIFFAFLNTEYKNTAIVIYTVIFLFNIIVTLYSQWKGVIQDKNRSVTSGMEKVFRFINKSKPTPRILCIPHQLCGMMLYNTKAKILSDTQLKGALQVSDVYPILKSPIKVIAKKHNLNMVVLKKTYATAKELNLKNSDLLLETEDTQIFRIG